MGSPAVDTASAFRQASDFNTAAQDSELRLRLIFGRDRKLFLDLLDFLRGMFPEETLHVRREFA
jgi:hypothetical protein